MTIITNNQEAMKTLGLEEISKAKAIALLKDAYRSIAAMIPAMLITWGAIISYIEYNILVRMKYKKIEGARPTAYIRNFSLKRENVIGWFIIYLGAYLFRFIGLEVAGIAVLNISIIVQSLIALQGTSVVFLIFYKRNINRILAAMLILMFWIMPMGKIGLFMLGAIDLLLNLRGKIN